MKNKIPPAPPAFVALTTLVVTFCTNVPVGFVVLYRLGMVAAVTFCDALNGVCSGYVGPITPATTAIPTSIQSRTKKISVANYKSWKNAKTRSILLCALRVCEYQNGSYYPA